MHLGYNFIFKKSTIPSNTLFINTKNSYESQNTVCANTLSSFPRTFFYQFGPIFQWSPWLPSFTHNVYIRMCTIIATSRHKLISSIIDSENGTAFILGDLAPSYVVTIQLIFAIYTDALYTTVALQRKVKRYFPHQQIEISSMLNELRTLWECTL